MAIVVLLLVVVLEAPDLGGAIKGLLALFLGCILAVVLVAATSVHGVVEHLFLFNCPPVRVFCVPEAEQGGKEHFIGGLNQCIPDTAVIV